MTTPLPLPDDPRESAGSQSLCECGYPHLDFCGDTAVCVASVRYNGADPAELRELVDGRGSCTEEPDYVCTGWCSECEVNQ